MPRCNRAASTRLSGHEPTPHHSPNRIDRRAHTARARLARRGLFRSSSCMASSPPPQCGADVCSNLSQPCIAFDLPGFGDSDLPTSPTCSAYADDITAGHRRTRPRSLRAGRALVRRRRRGGRGRPFPTSVTSADPARTGRLWPDRADRGADDAGHPLPRRGQRAARALAAPDRSVFGADRGRAPGQPRAGRSRPLFAPQSPTKAPSPPSGGPTTGSCGPGSGRDVQAAFPQAEVLFWPAWAITRCASVATRCSSSCGAAGPRAQAPGAPPAARTDLLAVPRVSLRVSLSPRLTPRLA